MRFVFAALIVSVCGVSFGQDTGLPQSVLNHNQPTFVAAPTVSTEPVQQAVTTQRSGCRNGRCCVGGNCRVQSSSGHVRRGASCRGCRSTRR